MKTSRVSRLDVNVEELDRVIDAAGNGPLSKSDCQKLKPRCTRWWNDWRSQSETREKTNSGAGTQNLILCGDWCLGAGWSWAQRSPCLYRRRKKSPYSTRNSNRATLARNAA